MNKYDIGYFPYLTLFTEFEDNDEIPSEYIEFIGNEINNGNANILSGKIFITQLSILCEDFNIYFKI